MLRAMLASAPHLFFLFLRQRPIIFFVNVPSLLRNGRPPCFSSPSSLPSWDLRHTGGSDFQARLEYDKVKKEIFKTK